MSKSYGKATPSDAPNTALHTGVEWRLASSCAISLSIGQSINTQSITLSLYICACTLYMHVNTAVERYPPINAAPHLQLYLKQRFDIASTPLGQPSNPLHIQQIYLLLLSSCSGSLFSCCCSLFRTELQVPFSFIQPHAHHDTT